MNMSQLAASRMIAEMEALLDAQLCERLSRGIRLTPLGQSLARHAHSVLLQLAQAEQEFCDFRAGRSGVVSIGAVTAAVIDVAVPAIGKIRAQSPKLELNIKIDASNVLARDLLASRLDFIVGRVPDDLEARLFDSLSIGIEEASLIVRRGHPLLAQAPVNVESLGAFEWVMQPRGSPLRRSIDALFIAHNITPPERFSNTTSLLLTMMLVAHSDAIAPISIEAAKFATGDATAGAIKILPTQFSIVVQPYRLIAMRNRLLSPAAQGVYSIIREEAAARERRAR
jgi:DNA-binding transcriptional LysR family regulator